MTVEIYKDNLIEVFVAQGAETSLPLSAPSQIQVLYEECLVGPCHPMLRRSASVRASWGTGQHPRRPYQICCKEWCWQLIRILISKNWSHLSKSVRSKRNEAWVSVPSGMIRLISSCISFIQLMIWCASSWHPFMIWREKVFDRWFYTNTILRTLRLSNRKAVPPAALFNGGNASALSRRAHRDVSRTALITLEVSFFRFFLPTGADSSRDELTPLLASFRLGRSFRPSPRLTMTEIKATSSQFSEESQSTKATRTREKRSTGRLADPPERSRFNKHALLQVYNKSRHAACVLVVRVSVWVVIRAPTQTRKSPEHAAYAVLVLIWSIFWRLKGLNVDCCFSGTIICNCAIFVLG